jgi:hypothetical protein
MKITRYRPSTSKPVVVRRKKIVRRFPIVIDQELCNWSCVSATDRVCTCPCEGRLHRSWVPVLRAAYLAEKSRKISLPNRETIETAA